MEGSRCPARAASGRLAAFLLRSVRMRTGVWVEDDPVGREEPPAEARVQSGQSADPVDDGGAAPAGDADPERQQDLRWVGSDLGSDRRPRSRVRAGPAGAGQQAQEGQRVGALDGVRRHEAQVDEPGRLVGVGGHPLTVTRHGTARPAEPLSAW